MDRFEDNQKIVVTDPDEDHLALKGKTGTVQRRLIRDNSAWIRMAEDLPFDLVSFPEGDDRHRDIVLFPDECEPFKETL